MSYEQGRGQTAVDLELRVLRRASAIENLLVDVGCQHLDLPVGSDQRVIENRHCDAVGLLARGAGRRPDVDAMRGGALSTQFGQDRLRQCGERVAITEERGLVRR